MPYINSDGTVVNDRSWFRFSIITDVFWSVTNIFGLFFNTLINPTAPIKKKKSITEGNNSNNLRKGPNIKTMKNLPQPCASGG